MQVTSQPVVDRSAGSFILRTIQASYLPAIPSSVSESIPFNLSYLGKDLVRMVTSGEIANKGKEGRYVDVVTPSGERLRVITRVIKERTNGSYGTAIYSDEVSAVNFSDKKPDALILVTYNPFTQRVEAFRFTPNSDKEGNFNPSYGVTWSAKRETYGKWQKNIFFTAKV